MIMYDLSVIGAGWAGFNACLKAKELGKKVCLIERSAIGGTCLNCGCIPTKSLIYSARIFSQTKKFEQFGIKLNAGYFDLVKAQERKNKIIQTLRNGMQSQLGGIDYFNAPARFITAQEIDAGGLIIKTKHALIATGAESAELDFLKFDGKKVLSSKEMLELKEIPQSLLIIGAGAIGCEFASIFSHLGAQVTLAEKMPQLLPGEDSEIARKIETVFKKKGIKVMTSCDAGSLSLDGFNLALVSVGRKSSFEGLALENIGINTEKGKVLTDGYLKTNINTIYAAGDCTAQLMLAHFASYQGVLAVENMFNQNKATKSTTAVIPNVIFTDPEAASVGLSQEQARVKGIDAITKRFDFCASGMAHIIDETEGFLKVTADKKTGSILGAHIVGPRATELIAIFSVAIKCGLGVSQIKETIFAHPTLSEAVGECIKK